MDHGPQQIALFIQSQSLDLEALTSKQAINTHLMVKLIYTLVFLGGYKLAALIYKLVPFNTIFAYKKTHLKILVLIKIL